MLSGETSVGALPGAGGGDDEPDHQGRRGGRSGAVPPLVRAPRTRGGAIARAAAEVGPAVGAKVLAAFTVSGDTARRLSRHRSAIPLLAFTPVPEVRSQLALVWGVEPFLVPEVATTDEMVAQVEQAMLELGRGERGERSSWSPAARPACPAATNAMRVHRLGDATG